MSPAAERFRIDYRLMGLGWAACDVTFGETSVYLEASYMDDALWSLISAASMLLQGAGSARASFENEPGQSRWGFDHVGDGMLQVRIWWLPETFSNRPDERGDVIFDQVVPERAVWRAVLRAADGVLHAHGEAAYQEQWGKPFPAEALKKLRRLFDERATE